MCSNEIFPELGNLHQKIVSFTEVLTRDELVSNHVVGVGNKFKLPQGKAWD